MLPHRCQQQKFQQGILFSFVALTLLNNSLCEVRGTPLLEFKVK